MHNILFITSNDNKLREAEAILGIKMQRQKLDVPEIQSMDLKEIIAHKLKAAHEVVKQPVILEDAALSFDAWNGFPGPFIKWMANSMGNNGLLAALPADNRKALWRVIYGYSDGNELITAIGEVHGTITTEKRGENGWGFDPIFIPEGETETFAEMGERKYDFSARKKALVALHEQLKERGVSNG
jgi:XTP/dITP diphosphohydrolase